MGLEVNRGYSQYNEPEPKKQKTSLRSLSAKRAAIILWHHRHPHSFKLFQKNERQLEASCGKARAYNETAYDLGKRLGRARKPSRKLALAACLARISNLKKEAERQTAQQQKVRKAFTKHFEEWRETLPLLDQQIADARNSRK